MIYIMSWIINLFIPNSEEYDVPSRSSEEEKNIICHYVDFTVTIFLAGYEVGEEDSKYGLVSLFNGISTFVGYLMPKPFS